MDVPSEPTRQLAVVEPTPMVLIQQALEAKYNPADLKELFELQRLHAADLAERAYADAITGFQLECPTIHKSKNVEGKYSYAPLEKIMAAILPVLRKYRIVVTFDTAESEGKMQVTCRTRVGVVEKHTTVVLPVPPANKLTNATQTSVGAISYGKRTALVAALNVVCTDEDHSGEELVQYVSDGQSGEIEAALVELAGLGHKVDLGRFCAIYGADSLHTIRAADFKKALNGARQAVAMKKAELAQKKAVAS